MRYRAEIDGLRTVAVVPVILFHAGFESFSGGFVGVDIFFVISGYLITSIILEELEQDKFSIVNFYERRARRIWPALFVVLFASLPFAWLWLLPQDMKNYSQSLVAVSAFASNLLFWQTSGYFDATAELKPLLHTWSLAVEEQYYLFFPLFLLFIWRLGKHWVLITLSIVAVSSLIAAQWGSTAKPLATFYLLPTRAWELLMGAFIASYASRESKPRLTRTLREIGAVFGLLLIAYAIFGFDEEKPFPSLYALVPTIGAALIITCVTQQTLAGKFLGNKLFVGIGLISYSAYLWHQPLFAFARHNSLDEPNKLTLGMLSAAAIMLAYLTWKYVENPFRNKHFFSRKQLFTTGAIVSCVFFIFGITGHFMKGFYERMSLTHLPKNYLANTWIEHRPINSLNGAACVSERASLCKRTDRPDSKKILLVGDSHSADYSTKFMDLVLANDLEAWQISVGGCAFIESHFARHQNECGKARKLLERSVEDIGFDFIIFISAMNAHIANLPPAEVDNNIESLADLLDRFMDSGAKVFYFTSRPYFNYKPTKAAVLNKISRVKALRHASHKKLKNKIQTIAEADNFVIFNQALTLINSACGRLDCFNGHSESMLPLYRDTNHLTTLGVRKVFSDFVAQSESGRWL
ncbi:acyltransferase family protein [Methylotuvimicrobium sp. KM2]|uniref:acyltransferase family protein n=1 Tax=Methylotuvimicrobium sp. KM2 TaxID=3133976 RepID=UPI003101653B